MLLHVVIGKPDGGNGYAEFTGTVAGNTMGGTFSTNEGDTGTWSVTR